METTKEIAKIERLAYADGMMDSIKECMEICAKWYETKDEDSDLFTVSDLYLELLKKLHEAQDYSDEIAKEE